MSVIRRYIAYLRDNPKRYWFKAKWYGWGWVPATWQGWLVILGFVAVISWMAFQLPVEETSPSDAQLLWFFGKVVMTIGVLVLVAYWKGEKPHWSWGPPKKKKR